MKTKFLLGTVAIMGLLAAGAKAQMSVSTMATNGLLFEPYNVVEDADNNTYASASAYNCIVRIDASTQVASVLSGVPSIVPGTNDGPASGFFPAQFFSPQGLLLVRIGGTSGLLVTDTGNNLIRFVRLSDGFVTTTAGKIGGGPANNATGLNATFQSPIGLDQDGSGNVYIADSKNNTIRVMNLNDPAFGVTNLVITGGTTFNQPTAVAYAGINQLWVADTGNHAVKLITLTSPTTGSLTTYMGKNDRRYSGTADNAFGPEARFNGPRGLLLLNGVGLLISDTGNNSIRLATNNPIFGVTNYSVVTFAGTPGTPGLVNGAVLSAKFNSPEGLCQDLANNAFLVADLANNAIRRIQTGPPQEAVPAPPIGWVDFTVPPSVVISILRPGSSFVFNNDVIIAIKGTPGTQTHFTFGTTPSIAGPDTIPNPSPTSGSTPPVYFDGMYPSQVPPSIISPQPDVTIKAIGYQTGRQNSPIISSRFQFVTATPNISGNNAAQIILSDITDGAQIYYNTNSTTDPVAGPPSFGPITSGTILSLDGTTNITFKARAFHANYQDSAVAIAFFSASNFVPNKISFGFPSGEASSDFNASPGQIFYAPVTLSILPNQRIYSLQFNLTVTNLSPAPPVFPFFGFQSMLMKPIPATLPPIFEVIPPAMFLSEVTNFVVVTNIIGTNVVITTNVVINPVVNPPPISHIIYPFVEDPWAPFLSLEFTNDGPNLLGIGWLERYGQQNLYDTSGQDLIKYSRPHDIMFDEVGGKVVLGGYAFQVPPTATNGQQYQIQIGRPSATSDGIGAPGSDVYIATPTNGSPARGAINSIKRVTVSPQKYIAGDSAPFGWFNAGDFGNTNLDNSDVMQVFQSAIYSLDNPPLGSDFFDAMDSCGGTYVDLGHGYLELNSLVTDTNALNVLFNGNDTTINQIGFGDGILDVCDVYVTFRRALDTNSLVWFRRFWTNGVRVAEIVSPAAVVPAAMSKTTLQPLDVSVTNWPKVIFASTDYVATAGQVLQIPITASVFGSYPLRALMLGLNVIPLDGSPALTTPIQFTAGALGQPTYKSTNGNSGFGATWLNTAIAGFTNSATIGTLTVKVPTNATSLSAYAIRFDHASASPNGLASFPKQALTGLITLSSRANSSYGDGIPDSWRLRYFLTMNNLLSQADADADGDGMNNRQEYLAGTDPTDPKSNLHAGTDPAAVQQNLDCVISWPSVKNKQYVIERSSNLSAPIWNPVFTNNGNGTTMEIHDTSGGNVRFYRVRVK